MRRSLIPNRQQDQEKYSWRKVLPIWDPQPLAVQRSCPPTKVKQQATLSPRRNKLELGGSTKSSHQRLLKLSGRSRRRVQPHGNAPLFRQLLPAADGEGENQVWGGLGTATRHRACKGPLHRQRLSTKATQKRSTQGVTAVYWNENPGAARARERGEGRKGRQHSRAAQQRRGQTERRERAASHRGRADRTPGTGHRLQPSCHHRPGRRSPVHQRPLFRLP